jgi:hypothetical protein
MWLCPGYLSPMATLQAILLQKYTHNSAINLMDAAVCAAEPVRRPAKSDLRLRGSSTSCGEPGSNTPQQCIIQRVTSTMPNNCKYYAIVSEMQICIDRIRMTRGCRSWFAPGVRGVAVGDATIIPAALVLRPNRRNSACAPSCEGSMRSAYPR